ncbi:S8 family serine peptidase [Marine Group I thaumarchaeote]|uniref:S8 family serine peptidase n=1 Tax=Marine Group I thaumarchaeote TaxID=2511932 RepID=A0A7K4M8C5_9ARCH|nr:S8 family serine peptidase [Marine Group I thaumarchaeote]NWJ57636.1 S8 family serine peptidase [Marine Group I thaumarchaeote]NWJ84145.1 S8 family serine peptidase [Marine Group I thaumarchaeote]NWK08107.1 S8 family serine peptidase [Marine Group I thaumarchaeote]NWK14119.1 S8 family serine peptidase [Marine Group I thaumarchaeote]
MIVFFVGFILFQFLLSENEIQTYLERSVPYIGTEILRIDGIDGTGIKVAVIDTGVDFNHPDLFGWGPDGKVVGGYNFIREDELPLDTNGHGTQVAGVIAADGQAIGVAPKAKILAYKVSEDGEEVSSELIIRAIEKAIEDGADIINISLGVNKTNAKIDRAVSIALEEGIFVVTAAGNDGPGLKTIGSPGRNFGSVTVGATYNNLASSLVATLEVDEKPYTVIPMVGSTKLEEPIIGKIIFGGFGKIENLKELDVKDAILIVERGSDVEGELLYFSIKESNAANAGAKAMIVYNNRPGIFLGELIHEFMEPGYKPQIPVVSVDREEGIEIKESIKNGNEASMHLFYNPDFVAHFSSRGPVSPFYLKPDIVAPGAYINSTQNNGGYNFTSGTSYAAPHVSGAAALLLQKNPELHHHEIKSLLLTTVEPVSDAYGKEFSVHEAGAGRLDIGNAYGAKLIIIPPNFVVNVSSDNLIAEKQFELKLIDSTLDNFDVKFEGPEFIKFESFLEDDALQIKMNITEENFGDHEGKIIVNHDDTRYVIPFLLHYTQGSISVNQQNQKLFFDIYHPEEWSFAKISVTNSKDGRTDTTTAVPNKNASIEIYENVEYWIDAKIRVGGNTTNAFNTIVISSLPENSLRSEIIDIPEKQIGIIAVIVIIIGIIGLIKRK